MQSFFYSALSEEKKKTKQCLHSLKQKSAVSCLVFNSIRPSCEAKHTKRGSLCLFFCDTSKY